MTPTTWAKHYEQTDHIEFIGHYSMLMEGYCSPRRRFWGVLEAFMLIDVIRRHRTYSRSINF